MNSEATKHHKTRRTLFSSYEHFMFHALTNIIRQLLGFINIRTKRGMCKSLFARVLNPRGEGCLILEEVSIDFGLQSAGSTDSNLILTRSRLGCRWKKVNWLRFSCFFPAHDTGPSCINSIQYNQSMGDETPPQPNSGDPMEIGHPSTLERASYVFQSINDVGPPLSRILDNKQVLARTKISTFTRFQINN